MPDPDPVFVRMAVTRAARDAGLGSPQAMTSSPGYEIPIQTSCPAQGKVILLVTHDGSVQFTIRAFMFRQFDKRVSVSDCSDLGVRRFPLHHISVDWLRRRIALAGREVHRLCEPEHLEKLRRAEVARQKQK